MKEFLTAQIEITDQVDKKVVKQKSHQHDSNQNFFKPQTSNNLHYSRHVNRRDLRKFLFQIETILSDGTNFVSTV